MGYMQTQPMSSPVVARLVLMPAPLLQARTRHVRCQQHTPRRPALTTGMTVRACAVQCYAYSGTALRIRSSTTDLAEHRHSHRTQRREPLDPGTPAPLRQYHSETPVLTGTAPQYASVPLGEAGTGQRTGRCPPSRGSPAGPRSGASRGAMDSKRKQAGEQARKERRSERKERKEIKTALHSERE
eukprot:2371148-Rhodomonas_salina.4